MFISTNQAIEDFIHSKLDVIKSEYLYKDVIVPLGKYKGRRGRVTSIVYFDFQGISMIIEPYRLIRKGNTTEMTDILIGGHRDARSYWPASRFGTLELI